MKIKVAIADDHPLVIKGLQHILANNDVMEVTGSFTSGSDLLRALPEMKPDVLILDIHMPDQRGDELAEIVNEKYPDVKMLALTNEDNIYHVKNMLRKGVLGYILKTTDEVILLDAIHTVYRGAQYLEATLKERLLQDTLLAKRQSPAEAVLSDREKEVLRYIAMDLTSQQIADKLHVSKRTVDYYRLCLLTKLDVKNVGALIKKGITLGFIE